MSKLIHPGNFLRNVLMLDAALSAALGALMVLPSGTLKELLGLPASLLLPAGLAMFPWAAFLLWIATRPTVPKAAIWAVVALNVLWAMDCGLAAFVGGFGPTALGQSFIALHALGALVLADLEFMGLRRSASASA
jgi:hypothetical protein